MVEKKGDGGKEVKLQWVSLRAFLSLRGHIVPEAIPEIASSLTLLAMTEKGNAPCNDERGNVRNDERGNVRNDERGNARNDSVGVIARAHSARSNP